MQAQKPFPRLPDHVRPEILKQMTVIELMVMAERFGARAIAARMGVDLATAIIEAAERGKK